MLVLLMHSSSIEARTGWTSTGSLVGNDNVFWGRAVDSLAFDDGSGPALSVAGMFFGTGTTLSGGRSWLDGGPRSSYPLEGSRFGILPTTTGTELHVGGGILSLGVSQVLRRSTPERAARSLTQPGGPGSGSYVSLANLFPGRE